jgi:hypothetical protein
VSRQALDELKQQIPLLDYLQAHDWQPARHLSSGRVMGLCPLHSDHKPSFLVDPVQRPVGSCPGRRLRQIRRGAGARWKGVPEGRVDQEPGRHRQLHRHSQRSLRQLPQSLSGPASEVVPERGENHKWPFVRWRLKLAEHASPCWTDRKFGGGSPNALRVRCIGEDPRQTGP